MKLKSASNWCNLAFFTSHSVMSSVWLSVRGNTPPPCKNVFWAAQAILTKFHFCKFFFFFFFFFFKRREFSSRAYISHKECRIQGCCFWRWTFKRHKLHLVSVIAVILCHLKALLTMLNMESNCQHTWRQIPLNTYQLNSLFCKRQPRNSAAKISVHYKAVQKYWREKLHIQHMLE